MDKHMIDEAMEVLVEAYAELHIYRTADSDKLRRHVQNVTWPVLRGRMSEACGLPRSVPLARICGWDGTDKPDLDGMRARLIKFLLSDRVD